MVKMVIWYMRAYLNKKKCRRKWGTKNVQLNWNEQVKFKQMIEPLNYLGADYPINWSCVMYGWMDEDEDYLLAEWTNSLECNIQVLYTGQLYTW